MARESDLDEKRGLKVACLLLVVRGRNHVLLRSTVFLLMPARTCQSWYKMYVLQQTQKHIYARR